MFRRPIGWNLLTPFWTEFGRVLVLTLVSVYLGLGAVGSAVAETLTVTLDKTTVLRPAKDVSIVMVGNPDIADVSVESARLVFVIGLTVGETNLLLLNRKGREIASYDIVVAPELGRHVTVNRGADSVPTLSCDPRCTGVANPGNEESGSSAAGGGAASGGGATSTAGAGAAAAAGETVTDADAGESGDSGGVSE